MLQKNWETTVCCFSREVVELKLSVCHSISWTPLSCADFPVLLWDYPVALLSLFYFCPLNQRLQDLPPSIMVIVCQANLTSSTCQASAGVSVKVTTRDGDSFLLPFRKQHTSRHPPAFIFPGRLRADLRSAERLAAMIFGDLSPAQWTCQSSSWV